MLSRTPVSRIWMRLYSMFVAAVLLILAPTTPGATQPAVESALVQRIVGALAGHPFGESRSGWQSAHASASWLQYRGAPNDLRSTAREIPDGLWCAVATDAADGLEREAVFYAIREERPLDCRLEELRYSVTAAAGASSLYDALNAALQQESGEPGWLIRNWDQTSRVYRVGAGYWGRPSGRWQDVRMWHRATSLVFLYRLDNRVEVLMRSFVLSADLDAPPSSATLTRHGMSRLTWELVNHVRARFPEAATVMQSQEGVVDQNSVERSSLGLLAALRRARSANERTVLALTAGQVLGRIRVEGTPPFPDRPGLAPIFKHGVTLGESPYDAGIWYYDGKFTAGVVQRQPKTYWTQLATVEKIDSGWISECAPAIDDVIREGTRWLKLNPRSEFAPRVIFDVAQAYDTAWSVSVAPEEGEAELPQPPGNSVARLRAIEWYQRVLREAPHSSEAVAGRRRLLQLRLGLDTGERRYFCEYA